MTSRSFKTLDLRSLMKAINTIPIVASDIETANPAVTSISDVEGLQPMIVDNNLELIAIEWNGSTKVTLIVTDEEQATAAVTFEVTVNPYDLPPPFKPVHSFQLKS